VGIEIAQSHHEKWDGSGYPDGLVGEDIPLAARIMAVADVYDALRSKRPYKPTFTHEESRDIILEGSGAHFDPDVVEAFRQLHEQFREIRDKAE
jgi:putative two-component system response regulator